MSVSAVEDCVLSAYAKTGTADREQLARWLSGGTA
jgi:hypothetical protein